MKIVIIIAAQRVKILASKYIVLLKFRMNEVSGTSKRVTVDLYNTVLIA